MTAANYAGLARLPLALIAAAALLVLDTADGRRVASWAVLLAIISDILDGVLSRRFNTVSRFGAVLDFTMDKVFVCPLLFLVEPTSRLVLALATLATIREFCVMGVRTYAAGHDVLVRSRLLGKLKTILIYPTLILQLEGVTWGVWVLALSVVLSWVSGVEYARAAWPYLRSGLFPRRYPNPDA